MKLFSADATIFNKKCQEKHPQKSSKIHTQNFFSPKAPKTAQTEEFVFQNVAYRQTGVNACKFLIYFSLYSLKFDHICCMYQLSTFLNIRWN